METQNHSQGISTLFQNPTKTGCLVSVVEESRRAYKALFFGDHVRRGKVRPKRKKLTGTQLRISTLHGRRQPHTHTNKRICY